MEDRQPAFITSGDEPIGHVFHGGRKYLWGNMPALDLLRLEGNEGADTTEDLRLLFAGPWHLVSLLSALTTLASGDIRNVVKTLAELPTTYSGSCEVVINDWDPDVVARNVILILIALRFSPSEAAPIMLHVWYSAMIPAQMLSALRENILPLIQDVCNKVRAISSQTLLSKTWTFGKRSLCLVLTKDQWEYLPSFFGVPNGLSADQAQAIRASVVLAPERRDYAERALFTQPPAWRVCTTKFREDGILLPFASSREDFDTPNP